jgi:hypothetical protein
MFTFRLLTDKTSNQSSRTKRAAVPPNEPKLSCAGLVTQELSCDGPESRSSGQN